MDTQDIVTGSRWDILKLIGEQPRTGADLAKAMHTSPANISQHLKLLELAGLVAKERVNGKSSHYRLSQDTALITFLGDDSKRETLLLDELQSLEFKLLLDKRPRAKFLRKFISIYEELIKGFLAFGTIKEGEDIQLLVIAEDVKPLRKEYANIPVGDKKIIIWSHTPTEFREGLTRKEHYFVDMLKHLTILYDPKHVLADIKEENR